MKICLISDFFYPNFGGVECHIYNLAQNLYKRGHKVIIVTHCYDDRVGVRYLKPFIKVYYIPFYMLIRLVIVPNFFISLPVLRHIFVREQIEIVHGHAAFSTFALDALLSAKMMGLRTVFTDHSLFGFNDFGAIMTNKMLEFTLGDIDGVICVSHTSKENTVLRARISPSKVRVIPNAIDTSLFVPTDSPPDSRDEIVIVVMSRLVYRKGIDLLSGIIPKMCSADKRVKFLIGGDGPKRLMLEELREQHRLHERVILLGNVEQSRVRDVLIQGHIFLNTSLTEAFCMAIVEAVSCGLPVVSTAVGGIVEVFPADFVCLAEDTSTEALTKGLLQTINKIDAGDAPQPQELHRQVKNMYSWADVTRRTEQVYKECSSDSSLTDRLTVQRSRGPVAGVLYCICYAISYLVLAITTFFQPEHTIETVPYVYEGGRREEGRPNTLGRNQSERLKYEEFSKSNNTKSL